MAHDCWEWPGHHNKKGRPTHSGKLVYRLIYALWRRIPVGLHVHHTCHNPGCVNPRHIALVTPGEHLALHPRRYPGGPGSRGGHYNVKTHCKHGHEFTPENTYLRLTGGRRCRTCHRELVRRQRKILPKSRRRRGPREH